MGNFKGKTPLCVKRVRADKSLSAELQNFLFALTAQKEQRTRGVNITFDEKSATSHFLDSASKKYLV